MSQFRHIAIVIHPQARNLLTQNHFELRAGWTFGVMDCV